jgi:hypothetical protein
MKAISIFLILCAIILVGCANDNYIIISTTQNVTNGTYPTGQNGTLIKVLNQIDSGNGTFVEEYQ